MDTVSKKKRSEIMSRVKSRDSTLETAFCKNLWKLGFRYRKNSPKYFGKPDLVLSKFKTVIFIDSCYWHGCETHCRVPSSNKDYWVAKIQKNRHRDFEVNQYYQNRGWQINRIWEHDIKKDVVKVAEGIKSRLNYGKATKEHQGIT